MKFTYKLALLFLLVYQSCTPNSESTDSTIEKRVAIEMVTDYGVVILELYNETPLHRDNFIKLTNEGAFDSLLFHRVIKNFMIQSGDPDSRMAQLGDTLGNGGLDYMVDAEFNPALFHKKGALGAARDGNLQRASSSTQFYIVQREVSNDSLLDVAETRINGWLAEHYFKNDVANKPMVDTLQKLEANENWDAYKLLSDSIRSLAKAYHEYEQYTIPEAHREVYKSIGGTPHLDQNYTVFGEVIKGLAVIDTIASVQTDSLDRPAIDARIRSVRVLK